MKAIWHNMVIAESTHTIVIGRQHYFPPETVKREVLRPSAMHTVSPLEGEASYYSINVDGHVNLHAAWYYPHPSPEAAQIRYYITFREDISITE
ncbi:DUF427 domain-containing protein [Chitinophaga agrisoli]|uniref:DUF427 domain-containing protein n=1 Tax=Chitinophaga agrisoli TaxID=2607653 RepID=A0A5B2VHZ7_9BACT|nr:DUF427 domain-containing protein [Chitinophaga agrisoli]KAA2238554.1 DUF427 domain-containing protein [Chitinophaga agrisoli]